MYTTQRIAIVTGSSRGIGCFLAEKLLKENYIVCGCSRSVNNLLDTNYFHAQVDVSNEEQVIAFVRAVYRRHHRIDALINNAGVASMNHLLLTPGSVVDKVMNVNYKGTFLFTREVGKLMQKQRRGRIVNFSSIAARLDLEGEAVYASSKGAIEVLTRISARELSPYGITVNAVAPCPIKTDLIAGVPPEKLDALVKRQVIALYATFEDVWNVVNFFLSEKSGLISGQILVIGGD